MFGLTQIKWKVICSKKMTEWFCPNCFQARIVISVSAYDLYKSFIVLRIQGWRSKQSSWANPFTASEMGLFSAFILCRPIYILQVTNFGPILIRRQDRFRHLIFLPGRSTWLVISWADCSNWRLWFVRPLAWGRARRCHLLLELQERRRPLFHVSHMDSRPVGRPGTGAAAGQRKPAPAPREWPSACVPSNPRAAILSRASRETQRSIAIIGKGAGYSLLVVLSKYGTLTRFNFKTFCRLKKNMAIWQVVLVT